MGELQFIQDAIYGVNNTSWEKTVFETLVNDFIEDTGKNITTISFLK